MKRIDKDLIVKYYEYFYKKRYNEFSFKYKPSEKTLKTINTFLNLIDSHYNIKLISEDFLWGYFIYQFNYWRNAELVACNGKFKLEYIIGKKAFLRFIDSSKDDHWLIEKSDVIKLYGFKKNELIQLEKQSSYSATFEEKNKKRFFNTEKGFYFCISNTTLFNDKHNCCLKCLFKENCKQLLKEKYNEIYTRRGY